ncbi:10975_t:CDS:2 [Funneliformis caledonium]|uniref:10975_t:CDS:1 n=1 Tax=Funneliformis caledonium TaxID=1117310 RepID=A0A9N9GX38_9GLOM|nr:10975_t:CDS:2 [Funneliformis caledonium]
MSLLNSSGSIPFLVLTAIFLFVSPVIFVGIVTMYGNLKQKISNELSVHVTRIVNDLDNTLEIENIYSSGKSTLGNMLLGRVHNNDPFNTSADMVKTVTIEDAQYSIVDTPRVFNDQTPSEYIIVEIFRYCLRCVYGIKAILIIFGIVNNVSYIIELNNKTTRILLIISFTKATWYTSEQHKTLEIIQEFFRNEALRDYIIIVFSKPTKNQMRNPNEMQRAWNRDFTSFIEVMNNHWIKYLIANIPGTYFSERFNEVRELYKLNLHQRQEEERLAERQRIENEQNIRIREAERIYQA